MLTRHMSLQDTAGMPSHLLAAHLSGWAKGIASCSRCEVQASGLQAGMSLILKQDMLKHCLQKRM